MEKNKTVWMFLTALVISLVIVGGSMTLSVAPKSAVQRCHNIAAAHRSRLSDADRRRQGRAVPHREQYPV
ncbi:MAG: hypothetical protein ACLT3Y_03585 [Ruminococcus callidus]